MSRESCYSRDDPTYFSTLSGSVLQDITLSGNSVFTNYNEGSLIIGGKIGGKNCNTKLYQLGKCDSRDGHKYLKSDILVCNQS